MSHKRIIITEFGGPEVLRVIEEPALPEPKPGEVRVKVLVTSAAFTDGMICKGMYPIAGARGHVFYPDNYL